MATLSPPPSLSLRFLTTHWGLSRALGEHLSPRLVAAHGLELRAYLILGAIDRGVIYPSDLALRLGLPRDATSRLLHPLLKQNLITRQIDPDDSRRVRLNVTADGVDLLGRVRATLEGELEPLLRELDEAALEQFLNTTETLRHNLSARPGDVRAPTI